MKKLLLLILIPTLASASTFTDIGDDHKNIDAINYLKNREVINGYTDGSFKPDRGVSRVELLKMAFKAYDIPTDPDRANSFSDVPEGSWFRNYVATAKSKGIIKGYADLTFKPDQIVSRSEAMKILYNLANIDTSNVMGQTISEEITDLKKEDWAFKYALDAKRRSLLDFKKEFTPNSPMSRLDIAELIYRLQFLSINNHSKYVGPKIDKVGALETIYETGVASYYADFFDGRMTANGETFRNSDMTAANRDLKFGTMLKVTNLVNDESVIVRVNDRGPYADTETRIIDLSKSAFEKISPISHGLIDVKVEKFTGEAITEDNPKYKPLNANDWRKNISDQYVTEVKSATLIRLKDGTEIKLCGVRTPGISSTNYFDAKKTLSELLIDNVIEYKECSEGYHLVYVDGKNINKLLINQGITDINKDTAGGRLNEFLNALDSAKRGGAGIWQQ